MTHRAVLGDRFAILEGLVPHLYATKTVAQWALKEIYSFIVGF